MSPTPFRISTRTNLMLSSQLNQVFRWCSGMIFSRPSLTASAACLPMSLQFTYHCGFIRGSTMSLERLTVWRQSTEQKTRLKINK